MSDSITQYGWTAVPRSEEQLLALIDSSNTKPIDISDLPFPTGELVDHVMEYAKKELTEETFNHSMRVYHYGAAILHAHHSTLLPLSTPYTTSQPTFLTTYLLAALLHDIGTTPTNLTSTHLSFEFHGAVLVLSLLKSLSAPVSLAESVAEAIWRHQDLGATGSTTAVGGLIVLSTLLDNVGVGFAEGLVHGRVVEDVVARWPRKGWSGCFARVVREEVGRKPWAHSTVIEGFAEKVEGNKVMEKYE
ncbi:cyanamide hydratase [Aulographum hederae CBS 113979]|uniref:Cyanamide hydratase n=1 Tax=Aulographum hederae CBS 113979 TaxID=1176131 RepID=A0A6G1GMR0_9PEZI|nr:cyanamide hydratase [Aulographum hederae CBS 113979]